MAEEDDEGKLRLAPTSTVKTKDADSESEIVARLAPRVRRITGSLLRNSHDAEDAAQLALLELVKAISTFRGEGPLEAFCDRVVVRTAIRLARARRLSTVRTAGDVDPDELPGSSGESDLAEGLPRTLLEYLHALPEVRRTALVLRHAMGYSVEEVAMQTGVSVNTVKSRLLEARSEVRRMVRRDCMIGAARSGDTARDAERSPR
jgi:RNA polymerase sigma factor (sigma-70 family)